MNESTGRGTGRPKGTGIFEWVTWLSEALGEDMTEEVVAYKLVILHGLPPADPNFEPHLARMLYVVEKEYPMTADGYDTANLYGEVEHEIDITDFLEMPEKIRIVDRKWLNEAELKGGCWYDVSRDGQPARRATRRG